MGAAATQHGGDGGHNDFLRPAVYEGSRIASCCAVSGWFDRHPTEDKRTDDVDKLGAGSYGANLVF